MAPLKVNVVARSVHGRNVTLQIQGYLTEGDLPPTKIECPEVSLKLTSMVWLVQEKLGLYLRWNKDGYPIPLESRNSVRLDSPIASPADWDGKLWLESYNLIGVPGERPKRAAFFLTLDFDR